MTKIGKSHITLPGEQSAIQARCFHPSGKFVEFNRHVVEQSIPARFEAIVRRYPDRVAVKTPTGAVTYDALNKAANRIAHRISAAGAGRQEPVALLLEQDISLFAAILGTLKADGIGVVLDSSLPRARIAAMLRDATPKLLLTDGRHLEPAMELAANGPRLLNLDEMDPGGASGDPGLPLSCDHMAYIVYTSGSTGIPKGVVQNHRNTLQEAMLYANGLHICEEDRLALLYSCSASQGIKITFAALLQGAGLYPFNLQRDGSHKLGDWLIREGITIYFSIPGVFREWAQTLTERQTFPDLRLLQLGSDAVTVKEVEAYRRHFSDTATLVVRLGSTETGTLARCYFDSGTPSAEGGVPVGYAPDEIEISFLDEEGHPVGFNQAGEITVASRYLSPGYWRRDDLTQAKFRSDPKGGDRRIYFTGDLGRIQEDGCIYHLGRMDFQVKVRGQRIELEEIENALLLHDGIRQAAVVAREDTPGDLKLVGYLVAAGDPAVRLAELRAYLGDKVPDYMVPQVFVFLETLPLTANGKVDRRALPAPDRVRPALEQSFVEPRTAVEKALAKIWADVLGIDHVGLNDSFFELGGHSLTAMQVVSRVRDSLGIELSLESVYEGTVAGVAGLVEQTIEPSAPGSSR